MNRITSCLSQLKSENKKALVTYIVSGDPRTSSTLALMHQLVASGADIIELGVPFSDPMAEGPVIQKAHERALAAKSSLKATLAVVSEFRQTDEKTPVVLMGYANPVERMGYETFADQAVNAGVDGLLTVDLPPEESTDLNKFLQNKGIETISLLAPTTTEERVQKIASHSSGFLYYVSVKGVTGAGHLDVAAVEQQVAMIRKHTELPLLVGFGIKDAESAKAVAATADGVIVGSLLVNIVAENESESDSVIGEKINAALSPIRQALNEI